MMTVAGSHVRHHGDGVEEPTVLPDGELLQAGTVGRVSCGDEMAEEIIFSVQESPEGGYEAHALSAPIFTEADNLEELRSAVRDATECHFEEGERPKLIRLHFVRDEVIAV